MSTHAVRKHAKLSASGRSRWSKCPASIRLSEDLPEVPSTDAAKEGTARHEWAEWCLRQGVTDAADMVGFALIDGEAVELPAFHKADAVVNEMTTAAAQAINVYLDAVWGALTPAAQTELHVEVALQFPGMHEGLGGTADACVWNDSTKTLEIFDFKNGYYVVDVKGNPQLLQYAIGAWMRFKDRRPRAVRLHVIQPRDSSEQLKTWEIDLSTLIADKMLLQAQAVATDDPNAACVVGNHCTFCPAAYHFTCKARNDFVEREAFAGFEVVKAAQGSKKSPGVPIEPAELARLLDVAAIAENFANSLRKYAKPLVADGLVPGKKVVVFQQRIGWNAHEDVIAAAFAAQFQGVDPWKPRDLQAPSDLEKVVGKTAFKEFKAQYTARTPFGTQIVDASDERPAVPNAATGFVPITTGS